MPPQQPPRGSRRPSSAWHLCLASVVAALALLPPTGGAGTTFSALLVGRRSAPRSLGRIPPAASHQLPRPPRQATTSPSAEEAAPPPGRGRSSRFGLLGLLGGLLLAASPAAAASSRGASFAVRGLSSADLFPVQNLSLLTWALLLFLPRWSRTKQIALLVPLLHSALYVALAVHGIMNPVPGLQLDMTSLAGVTKLFRVPDVVFAGWLHYCVFDSLIGLAIVTDSRNNGIPHFVVFPCLLLTMFMGPSGFLLYFILRAVTIQIKKPRGLKGVLMGKNWR